MKKVIAPHQADVSEGIIQAEKDSNFSCSRSVGDVR
jgi:hypothetical protein